MQISLTGAAFLSFAAFLTIALLSIWAITYTNRKIYTMTRYLTPLYFLSITAFCVISLLTIA